MIPSTTPPFPAAEAKALLVLARGPARVVAVTIGTSPTGEARLDLRVWVFTQGRWEATRTGLDVRPGELQGFTQAVVAGGQRVAEAALAAGRRRA